jgi:hypothetical protein
MAGFWQVKWSPILPSTSSVQRSTLLFNPYFVPRISTSYLVPSTLYNFQYLTPTFTPPYPLRVGAGW